MRKLLFLALVLISTTAFSQAPEKINYQAVARDASGNIVTTSIGIKFEIIQGSVGGTVVYEETHNVMPSSAGIFVAEIGNGTIVSGTFSSINWANSPYFIRVSIDPAGGTSYNVVGTSELLSVPYALYAKTAGNTQTVSISGPNVIGAFPNYTITPGSALTASTGISISSGTITNTAPDKTVTITGATGTYPDFTVTPTPATSLTATGTGISITGTGPAFTIVPQPSLNVVGNQLSISDGNTVTLPTGTTYTPGAGIAFTSGTVIANTAMDQTVVISNGTNVTVNSAYPNFTINATPTLSLSTNILTISGGNSVTLPTPPSATTVSAGTNINVTGTAPNYTVSSPTYSLNFPSSSVVNVTNGINTSTASIPQPTLTVSGTNSNVISAGSNSITIPHYTAGNGLTLAGTAPNYTLGTVMTGTSAPWSTLGNTATNAGVNFLGTTDAQDLVFRTGNSQRMRLYNTNGNVGIGNITTPTELLQVETGSNTAVSVLSGTNSTLYFGNAGNHFLGAIRYDNINNTMNFWTNNTADRIFIDAAGKIGMGLNLPVSELDVNGSLRLNGNRLFLGAVGGINSGYTGLYSDATGDLKFAVFQSGAAPNPPFASAGSSRDAITIRNTSGNVGIGTTTPVNKLDVAANAVIGSAYAGVSNAPADGLLVQGNVGIGTTSPGGMLHVRSSGSGYIIHENTAGGTNPYGMLFTAPGQSWYFLANSGTGPANSLGIFDGNASAMRMIFMPTNGFVGVGTSAPASLFHVNGAITMTDGSQGAGKVLTSNTAGTATWKTNQIAFFCGGNSAATTTTFNTSTTTTLVFNSGASPLAYNMGSAYAVASGQFTAPVSGVYQFDADVTLAGAPSGFIQIKLRHSSGNIIAEQEGFFNTVGQNWWSGNLSATVHLNAGERVAVEYYSGSAGGSTFYHDKSSFSGHLVYAD